MKAPSPPGTALRRHRIPEAIQEGMLAFKRATTLWGPAVHVSEVYADLSSRYVLPRYVRSPQGLFATPIDPVQRLTLIELATALVPTGVPGAEGYRAVNLEYRYAFFDQLEVGDAIHARCIRYDVRRERERLVEGDVLMHIAHEVNKRLQLCGSLIVRTGFESLSVSPT